MPYKVTKFVCSICQSENYTEEQAIQCERKGYPETGGEFNEGDFITYNNEDGALLGTFTMLTNKILFKMIRNINGEHRWVYIVEQNLLGEVIHEKGVILVNGEYYAPANLTYKPGYSEYVRKIINEINTLK